MRYATQRTPDGLHKVASVLQLSPGVTIAGRPCHRYLVFVPDKSGFLSNKTVWGCIDQVTLYELCEDANGVSR